MPQLAYSGAPTVGPANVTQDSQQIHVTPEAFGAGVGRSLEQFGGTLQHTSDSIYQEVQKAQAIQNDTEARDVTTATQVTGGNMSAEYHAKEGLDAVNSRPAFVKGITDLVKTTAEGIKNPIVKKMYLDQMTRQQGAWLNSSATWAAGQQRVAANNSADAAIALAQNNAGEFANDDKAFSAQVESIHDAVKAKAALKGWDETSTKAADLEATSKAWLFRYSSLAQSDPAAAKAMYDKHKASDDGTGMNLGDDLAVQKTISAGLVAKTSRSIANDVTAGQPTTVRGLISALEASRSFSPKAYLDHNEKGQPAGFRLGYGSDTITAPDGSYRHVRASDTVDQAGADRDLDRRIGDQDKKYQSMIGADKWNTLPDATKAVLHSIMWNYGEEGSGPKKLAAVINAGGGSAEIAAAIRGLKTGGILNDRREKEARMVETGNVPAGKARSLKEMQDEGAARANAIDPGNDQLLDSVQSHITTDYNLNAQQERLTYAANKDALVGAVFGSGDYAQQPHSLADITNNPALNTAYQAMKEVDQRAIVRMINAQNTVHEHREPNQQELDQYHTYLGESEQNPQKLADRKLAEDPDFEALPGSLKQKTLTLQSEAIKKLNTPVKPTAPKDPVIPASATNLAIKSLGEDTLVNVFGSNKSGSGPNLQSPEYMRFTGALTDWARTFAATHDNVPPTDEQLQKEAAALIRRNREPNEGGYKFDLPQGLGGKGLVRYEPAVTATPRGYETYHPTYVPAVEAAKIKAGLIKAGNENPTPLDIRHVYEGILKGSTPQSPDNTPYTEPEDK